MVAVQPLVKRWWPIVDSRWHFDEVKDTRTSAIDHSERNICRADPTVRADTSPLCAMGHLFYGNGAGSVYGLGGHGDFETATYEGRLWFEDHSPATPAYEGYDDDDVSWNIRPSYGEGSLGGERWIHVERSAWSSLRRFRAANPSHHDFWTGLVDAIDRDNAARMQFEGVPQQPGSSFYPNANVIGYLYQKLPPEERTNLATEPDISKTKVMTVDSSGMIVDGTQEYALPAVNHAIVIGNLGLDCYHGCNPELHPAYLVAIRVRSGPFSEKWAFVAHNSADEGLCSANTHSAPPELNNGVHLYIPHIGAKEAVAYASTQTDIFGSVNVGPVLGGPPREEVHWAEGGAASNKHVHVELIPRQGAIVSIYFTATAADNPDPQDITSIHGIDWVEGELNITWAYPVNPQSGAAQSSSNIHSALQNASATAQIGANHLGYVSTLP